MIIQRLQRPGKNRVIKDQDYSFWNLHLYTFNEAIF